MKVSGVSVQLRKLSRFYGDFAALEPSDLEIGPGEFVTLLGPSGSGKTTLLHLLAGHVEPTGGRILLGGKDVGALPARRRNIGMVFQNYALFPHMSVGENVGYGLRVRGWPRAKVDMRVQEVLGIVRLPGFSERAIQQLSGGQQQRVALARALAIEPDLVLMDEPLSALDRQLRRDVQLELRRLHEAYRRTTVYVTHDQEEALILSDRIAVMQSGRIEQIGTARELYDRPANAFVAGFIGESNLLKGRIKAASNGTAAIEIGALGQTIKSPAAYGLKAGDEAKLLIRPEHVRISANGGVKARVLERVDLGELLAIRLVLAGGEQIWARQMTELAPETGDEVDVVWPENAHWVVPCN